jgi:hypothetical protein
MTAAGRTASTGFTRAAGRAAKEQVVPVETTDSILRGQGRWHDEVSKDTDRQGKASLAMYAASTPLAFIGLSSLA